MNKILYLGLVLTLCLIIFSGCHKKIEIEETNDQTPLESLIDDIASVEEVYQDIPSELKEKVVAPSIDVIPFQVEKVVMHYNNATSLISIGYYGEDRHVNISVWSWAEEIKGEEQVTLKNNITGYYNNDYQQIGLQWREPEEGSNLIYTVGMATFKENTYATTKNEFSKEDAIKIANSMIENDVKQ